MASVTIENLVKTFGTTQVLKGVSLQVPSGGFCVLVGSSGCGKSTLLRCLAGLEEPNAGSIHIGDQDVTRLAPRDRDIAMVFQSYALYPHLNVFDNLAFGLKLRKTAAAEINTRVQEAASLLGLETLLQRFPRQLSGGQRQRVAMGRAIVRRPKLFLFDEPLSNLDAALRGQVRVQIRKLHDALQATSVYVTHDQVEAMTLADVMVVLNQGSIEQAGHPLDIYRHPVSKFVGGFLGNPSMSFVSGTITDGGNQVRLLDGSQLQLKPALAGCDGQEVDVGIRAEDIEIAEESGVNLQVEVVEALGSETFAHVQGKVGKLVVKLAGDHPIRVGETITVRVSPEHLHVFRRSDGKRCTPNA
jgi:multiple sugar transport system ATP-binding protein